MEKKTLTIGEMFSGPGGIGLAVNKAHNDKFSFQHVWSTDYDKDTCETYKKNVLKDYPNAVMINKDVHELDIDSLPLVDGFLYGFPCNDFSIVGEQKGFDGNFGPLYSFGVKYIERANPRFFFAENVSGINSANSGKALKKILHDLNHAGLYGYNLTVHLYKFEDYGIPQTRHRIIIVGFRGDLGLTFKVPKPNHKLITCKEALSNPPIPLTAPNQEQTKQSKIVIERLSYIKPGENAWQAEHRMPEDVKLHVKSARMSQIYKRLDPNKPSYTITGSGGGGTHVYHWEENRALTNRERARLQTFPDDFEFVGSKESVRKQIGMAVPYKGAQVILEAILKSLAHEEYASIEPSNNTYEANSIEL